MEIDERDFRLYHRYRRLVRRGIVKPLTHDCGGEYYTSLDHDDRLVLKCPIDDATVYPGLQLEEKVRTAVERYFEE